MIEKNAILFIEPTTYASDVPVIDAITRKMCAALRAARRGEGGCGGVHSCFCDAMSSSSYRLPNGKLTNSLCVHYLAHHREEIPPEQLEQISRFTSGEVEPTEDELIGPHRVAEGVRRLVDRRIGQESHKMWTSWGLDVATLCKRLQGGYVGGTKLFTDTRQEAEDLFTVIHSIQPNLLPVLKKSVLAVHLTMNAWGERALRLPGWDREAWITPFVDFMRVTVDSNKSRRAIAMRFRDLGPKSAVAISELLQIAKSADETHRYDIRLIFSYFQEISGLPIPPEVEKFMSQK